jgi:uncharacterized protein
VALRVFVSLFLALAFGFSPSRAENEDSSRYPHLQAPAVRVPQQRPLNVRAVPSRSSEVDPLNPSAFPSAPSVRVRSEPRYAPMRRQAPTMAESLPVIKPKINPSTFIAVMGDAMGEQLAQGLDETFGERTDVMILRKARADSGLVRADFYDWPKAAGELMANTPRLSFAVMLMGVNDRQQIRDGEVMVDPFTDRWKELYSQRVRELVKAFSARNIPLVWASVPPVRNEALSADMLVLNTLYRDAVVASGGIYVDLWEPFADEEKAFTLTGPDVSGKMARLRLADGIHFTPIGARKAAYFVHVELKRLMEQRGPALPVAISPVESVIPGEAASLPQEQVPSLLPLPRIKPTIGATYSLTSSDLMSSERKGAETLMSVVISSSVRSQRISGAKSDERTFSTPVEGRADDFRWPRP